MLEVVFIGTGDAFGSGGRRNSAILVSERGRTLLLDCGPTTLLGLKALAIDGGNGCVAPSEATINDGSYAPLSRPLFIYVRQDVSEVPHIREFLNFYLSADGRALVSEVGYIPFQERVYDLVLGRVNRGQTGPIFGGGSPQKGSVEAVLSANQ